MKLNLCLTIIALRGAQGGNIAPPTRTQNNVCCEHAPRHSAVEGNTRLRSSNSNRGNTRRIATRGLWLQKATV